MRRRYALEVVKKSRTSRSAPGWSLEEIAVTAKSDGLQEAKVIFKTN
jgi:hypothetical protein